MLDWQITSHHPSDMLGTSIRYCPANPYNTYYVSSTRHPLAHLKWYNVTILSMLLSDIRTEWCEFYVSYFPCYKNVATLCMLMLLMIIQVSTDSALVCPLSLTGVLLTLTRVVIFAGSLTYIFGQIVLLVLVLISLRYPWSIPDSPVDYFHTTCIAK